MPANTTPIFPLTPNVAWGTLATANTAVDGTGTVVTIFTAGANGARIDKIVARAKGTNVATVLRLFVNNGSTNATAANNSLVYEQTIAATTANAAAALADNNLLVTRGDVQEAPVIFLPAGYKINATVGTTIAAGLQVTVFGGDY